MIFSVKLEGLQASRDHLILNVREGGLQEITIFALPPLGTPITCLPEGQNITFPEPTYELEPEEYQFESHIFRYGYSSLRTPKSVYDYDMNIGKSVLKKMKPVCDWFLFFLLDLYCLQLSFICDGFKYGLLMGFENHLL